jgi:cardiolipin synthase
MLERIASAEHRVHFENYIFRADQTGRRFAGALAERARAGVEVRIIYDWFGSISTPNAFWKELRDAGCEVHAFGPPSPRRPLAFLRRDHRKLLVTDGRFAVIGGLCIGDEWSGNDDVDPWRDTAIELEGPIARQLDDSFAAIWHRVRGKPYLPLDHEPLDAGKIIARIIDGPPIHARAYRLYQLIAALTERTLYITGAYPLFPTPLRSALAAAARSGVDVRLLAPGHSDLALLNQAARAQYTRLLRAGVRIYEWKGPMLHAKTVAADGKLAIIGSSNLNPYSFLSTYELDVIVEDRVIASTLEYQFLDDLEGAREITLAEWSRRPASQRWRERLGVATHWLPYRLFN